MEQGFYGWDSLGPAIRRERGQHMVFMAALFPPRVPAGGGLERRRGGGRTSFGKVTGLVLVRAVLFVSVGEGGGGGQRGALNEAINKIIFYQAKEITAWQSTTNSSSPPPPPPLHNSFQFYPRAILQELD